MGRCLMVCALVLVCLANTAFAASPAPLRIGFDENYPPFSFKNAEGNYTGFDVDVAAALCKRLLRTCQMVAMPFDELFGAMQQGKLDVLVAGVAKNAEREKFLLFVVPYYRSRTALVGKVGESYPQVDAQSMRGKRLAAQESSVQHEFIIKHLPQSVYVPTVTVNEALHAVRDGKVDIALADSLVCMAVLQAEDMQSLDYVAEPLSAEHESSTAYIAVNAGQGKLAAELREAFGQLRLSGEFNGINQKYFPFSIY